MDANTPAGRESLANAKIGLDAITAKHPTIRFLPFSDDEPSVLDGMIIENGVLTGLYEVKARHISIATFAGEYKSEWLITYEKIAKAEQVCNLLRLKMVGILVLIPSKMVIVKTLIDSSGSPVEHMRVCRTDTQKSVNGGRIVRTNAFINMTGANVFTI